MREATGVMWRKENKVSRILLFFPSDFTSFTFQTGGRNSQAGRNSRFLLLSASSHPGSLSRAGSHSNSAHLPLAPSTGEVWPCCWASMRTWNQSWPSALQHVERLGSALHSNRLEKALCQFSLCSDGFIHQFVAFLLTLILRGQAPPNWWWWAAFHPENPTGRSDLGLGKLVELTLEILVQCCYKGINCVVTCVFVRVFKHRIFGLVISLQNMKAFHSKCTFLIIFNIKTRRFLAGILSVCYSVQFFTFSSFVIMQFSLHWVRATSWWDYCGCFFPQWGVKCRKWQWEEVLAYLPRVVRKLKHIYEIIKN